ncbi:MAG: aminopeptidase [Coriobacteriales bacterium]|jgi:aminopeptidase|nr:aminopeptidase [Coriobacteriales bacterium]
MDTTAFTNNLQKYAQLIIKSGCNLKAGQELFISISTECVEFARLLTAEAYAQGARHVTVKFHDEKIARLHYDNCPLEVFESVPEWAALLNNSMAREGAAILSVVSSDPYAMVGIDQAKPVASAVASHAACKEFYDALDLGRVVWCIVGAAAPAWARVVFPAVPVEQAVAQLWDAIFAATRVTAPDPVLAWEAHRASFNERKQWLNEQQFDALQYRNSRGTHLTIGLNARGIWQGGGDMTIDGTAFFPNMPTEELFTTPDRLRAEGVVYSSLPLVHNGALIEDFSLRFKEGRVVDCQAAVGQDVLEAIFKVDQNAARLGEVALIPYTSPIRQSGILFYSTLFDENASCHLAVGQGFPDCLEGGQTKSEDELLAAGVNKSATHVDFMIGTPDLQITGITASGEHIPVFKDGEWAF